MDRSLVRDRSAAAVPGSTDSGPAGSGLPPGGATGAADGGLAGALAAALNQRKKKVSASGKFFVTPFVLISTNYGQMMKQTMMTGKWLVKTFEKTVEQRRAL